MKKKIGRLILTIVSAIMILALPLTLTGCSSIKEKNDAKKQAKENANLYKGDFEATIIKDFGSDAVLSDVEGSVREWYGELDLFPSYNAKSELTGIMEKNGKAYHATYDFNTKTLKTDYNTGAIFGSLIDVLGLDPSKITYTMCYDDFYDRAWIELPVYIDTMAEVLAYNQYYLKYYIVTSEPLADKDFERYFVLCRKYENIHDVNVFSSDNFGNLDHFKTNIQTLKYHNTPNGHSMVLYDNKETDIFTVYNLNEFAGLTGYMGNETPQTTVIRK